VVFGGKGVIISEKDKEAMVRAMCEMKLMDRKNTDEFMDMLGLNETLDKMAIASGCDVLREALQF